MSNKRIDYYTVHNLASIFAKKNPDEVNYIDGPHLLSMFQGLGFKDYYSYEKGDGIIKADGTKNISRLKYATDRLLDLNKKKRIDEAIDALIDFVEDREIAQKEISQVLGQDYNNQVTVSIERQEKDNMAKSEDQAETEILQPNFIEDSVLGKLPTDHPKVFISYSWDGKEHEKWVEKLANDLTSQGVFVLYDQYTEMGTDLPTFMERGIEKADRVLIIGTTRYKQKYDLAKGGVPFEENIIYATFYQEGVDIKKFVPCLREGSYKESFPKLISTKKGFDFSNDSNYHKELKSLCKRLWSKSGSTRPTLGDKPDYAKD